MNYSFSSTDKHSFSSLSPSFCKADSGFASNEAETNLMALCNSKTRFQAKYVEFHLVFVSAKTSRGLSMVS